MSLSQILRRPAKLTPSSQNQNSPEFQPDSLCTEPKLPRVPAPPCTAGRHEGQERGLATPPEPKADNGKTPPKWKQLARSRGQQRGQAKLSEAQEDQNQRKARLVENGERGQEPGTSVQRPRSFTSSTIRKRAEPQPQLKCWDLSHPNAPENDYSTLGLTASLTNITQPPSLSGLVFRSPPIWTLQVA